MKNIWLWIGIGAVAFLFWKSSQAKSQLAAAPAALPPRTPGTQPAPSDLTGSLLAGIGSLTGQNLSAFQGAANSLTNYITG